MSVDVAPIMARSPLSTGQTVTLVVNRFDSFIAYPPNGVIDEAFFARLKAACALMGYKLDPHLEYGPDLGYDEYGYIQQLIPTEEVRVVN